MINFIIADAASGGESVASQCLAMAIKRRGYEVQFTAIAPLAHSPPRLLNAEICFKSLNRNNAWRSISSIVNWMQNTRPSVIITASPQASVVVILSKLLSGCSCEIYVSEHTLVNWLLRRKFEPRLWLVGIARIILYPNAAAVVGVSQAVCRELSFPFPFNERLGKIGNCVLNRELVAAARRPARHPWLISKQTPVIVALGHLIRPKGFDVVLDAMAIVSRLCNARLIIYGEGNQRSVLEEQVVRLKLSNVVDLPGFCDNAPAEIAAADLLVSGSYVESVGLTVCEAICLGVPVVASDAYGGMREIVDGSPLVSLVSLGDAVGFSKCIISRLQGVRQTDCNLDRFREMYIANLWSKLLEDNKKVRIV